MREMRPLATAAVAVLAVATVVSAIVVVSLNRDTSPPSNASGGPAVTVTRGSCGGPWHAAGGTQIFEITNGDIVTTEVKLVDPRTGGVYAEVDSLAPNATRPMQVALGHGAYAFRCFPEDSSMLTGPTVMVTTGRATGSPAVLPLNDIDLVGPVKAYRSYVDNALGTLAADVAALDTAVRHGTRARAEAAWLTAHLAWARIGAVYDTFGDVSDAIDGMPDGLPGGVSDPDFTGFHRVEYGLWHGQSLPSLAGPADRLVTDVAGVRHDFPTEEIDPNDLPLRAHEIMENALEFDLTGHADQGSGTSLAFTLAAVDGTQAVLATLAPVMRPRYTGWPSLATWIATARTALARAHRADGSWIPVAALTAADRERIDAAVGGLLEALAPIAAIGEVRRTQ